MSLRSAVGAIIGIVIGGAILLSLLAASCCLCCWLFVLGGKKRRRSRATEEGLPINNPDEPQTTASASTGLPTGISEKATAADKGVSDASQHPPGMTSGKTGPAYMTATPAGNEKPSVISPQAADANAAPNSRDNAQYHSSDNQSEWMLRTGPGALNTSLTSKMNASS